MSTPMTDFTKIGTIPDRMKEAKKQLIAVGVPVSEATTAVAIAARESGALFAVPREQGLPYSHDCWTMRALVGAEFIFGRDDRGAAVVMIPSRMANDPDVYSLMTSRGWATDEPKGGGFTYPDGKPLLTGPKYLRPAGEFAIAGNWSHAYMFEYMLINRKANMLGSNSFGPTMKNTINTGEAARAGMGWGKGCGFADTWNDIFHDYLATTWEQMAVILNYMRKTCTNSTNPADHPNDDAANIEWLRLHQTGGTTADATPYYNNYFKPNLKLALSL